MGLDMYLTAKRYLPEYNKEVKEMRESITATIGSPFGTVNEVSVEAGYWRKANAIHKWFVTNCQNGIDECQETYVDSKDLKSLLETVNTVLTDNSTAGELLPPSEGFFFGSTEIDEYYIQDLEYTKELLEKILNSDQTDWEFYYRSSW